jgi:hypothetical protein
VGKCQVVASKFCAKCWQGGKGEKKSGRGGGFERIFGVKGELLKKWNPFL